MTPDGTSCQTTATTDAPCKYYADFGGGGSWCEWCDKEYYANWIDYSQPCTKIPDGDVIKDCRWAIMTAEGIRCLACKGSNPSFDLTECNGQDIGNCKIGMRFPGAEVTQCAHCNSGYVSVDGICRF